VKSDHVGLFQKGFQIAEFCLKARGRFALSSAIGQDRHAQSACDVGHRPADRAKTDDSELEPFKLEDGSFPVAEIRAFALFTIVYSLVVVSNIVRELQQEGNRALCNRRRTVGRDICDNHAFLGCCSNINYIVAGSHYFDISKAGRSVQSGLVKRDLVRKHCLSTLDSLS